MSVKVGKLEEGLPIPCVNREPRRTGHTAEAWSTLGHGGWAAPALEFPAKALPRRGVPCHLTVHI